MWKLQHMEGQREINELHIPVGRAVKLTMTREDVIHSFFVPAFRTKQDVVPGRYTTDLVQAHQARQVSPVLRRVLRHQPFRHDRLDLRDGAAGLSGWLSGGAAPARWRENGEKLFQDLACSNCHKPDGIGPLPEPGGICSASRCNLPTARSVKADEAYIRESILSPRPKSWPAISRSCRRSRVW